MELVIFGMNCRSFQRVPVFHKVKFWNADPHKREHGIETLDVAHARPKQKDKRRDRWRPGRFDTVLVKVARDDTSRTGIHRYRVAQLRNIFSLPSRATPFLFQGHVDVPKHLAYVEWFSEFRPNAEAHHLMYKVTHSIKDGKRDSAVIRVSDIERSVALIPKFGPVAPREWTSANVLEECTTFYVNPFTDRHTYISLY